MMPTADADLSVRVTPTERDLLVAAAEHAYTDLLDRHVSPNRIQSRSYFVLNLSPCSFNVRQTGGFGRKLPLEYSTCRTHPVAMPQWLPETTMGQLDRIAIDPAIFGGKPIVRGMRISVELILNLLAQGETQESILDDYPGLQPNDIRACLAYAHAVLANDRLDDLVVAHV